MPYRIIITYIGNNTITVPIENGNQITGDNQMISYSEFEKQIAYYCAPCFVGIKPASLFATNIEVENLNTLLTIFEREMYSVPIRIKIMSSHRTWKVLLVYHVPLLEKQLHQPQILSFLRNYSYPIENGTRDLLDHLQRRMKAYKSSQEYPHEVGIFLGYPLDDIIGFIKNHGQHYKLSGYWKVYANESNCLELFQAYSKSRMELLSKMSSGFTLKDLHTPYVFETN